MTLCNTDPFGTSALGMKGTLIVCPIFNPCYKASFALTISFTGAPYRLEIPKSVSFGST